MDPLPDNNQNINIKGFLLDPLSVIIKLAILSNKPVGTKILIKNNILYFYIVTALRLKLIVTVITLAMTY